VNILIAGRTPKQYRDDNAEIIKSKAREYYKNNKEKEWGKKICYEKHKERHKQYYENNKIEISAKKKERYNRNKKKVACECGRIVLKQVLPKHKKTKVHKTLMANKSI